MQERCPDNSVTLEDMRLALEDIGRRVMILADVIAQRSTLDLEAMEVRSFRDGGGVVCASCNGEEDAD